MNQADLRQAFERTAKEAGATRSSDRAFELLSAAYLEPQRAYHTLAHIEHGIELLETLRTTLTQPGIVTLAYWFHDAVYRTGLLANNEAASAKLAETLCADMGVPAVATSHIQTMVLATKRHELPAGTAAGDDRDLETLLDVDLSILAADPLTYARFERDVRKEYAHIPEFLYARGRKKALGHFLERAAIYHRPELRARWESCARSNLARALRNLEADREHARSIEVSDACIFTTIRGRLELELPWASVSHLGDEPRSILVYRAGEDLPAIAVPRDVPALAGVVRALRVRLDRA